MPSRQKFDPLTTTNITTSLPATSTVTVMAEERAPIETRDAVAAIWAVVLAGGIGSRFWPLSSSHRPKQLLTLLSDRPLIAETIDRLQPLIPVERVLVVTSADIAPAIASALPTVPARNILIEPGPLGTAAAVAWGASEVARRGGPDAVACCVHADIAIGFVDIFHHTLREATKIAAQDDVLVMVGVPASRPDVAFGYIVPGEPLDQALPLSESGACSVISFVEKPDSETAADLLESEALWHSGVFAWRSSVLLGALEELTPEIAVGLPMLKQRDHDAFMEVISSVSIERGLFERSSNLVVVPGDFGWDDVGTWASLRRARELDDDGNGVFGDCAVHDATGNVVHAEASTVVLYGVSGLLVVSLNGLTFVTTLDRATDLRSMLDALPDHVRSRTPDSAGDPPAPPL